MQKKTEIERGKEAKNVCAISISITVSSETGEILCSPCCRNRLVLELEHHLHSASSVKAYSPYASSGVVYVTIK